MRYLHTMVRVADLDKALRFYSEGLGLLEISRKDDPVGRYSLIFLSAPMDRAEADDAPQKAPLLELTYNWPAPDGTTEAYGHGRNFGHLAFEVDDIYALCQKLSDMGYPILRPPRDGRMAFVKSDDGISIELLQKGQALPLQEPWLSQASIGNW